MFPVLIFALQRETKNLSENGEALDDKRLKMS